MSLGILWLLWVAWTFVVITGALLIVAARLTSIGQWLAGILLLGIVCPIGYLLGQTIRATSRALKDQKSERTPSSSHWRD